MMGLDPGRGGGVVGGRGGEKEEALSLFKTPRRPPSRTHTLSLSAPLPPSLSLCLCLSLCLSQYLRVARF